MGRNARTEERSWILYLDESGNFHQPKESVLLGGFLGSEPLTKTLTRWGEGVRQRLPHIPWPFHQSHLRLPTARLFWYVEAKVHHLENERFSAHQRTLCQTLLDLLEPSSWKTTLQPWKERCQTSRAKTRLPRSKDLPLWKPLPYDDAKALDRSLQNAHDPSLQHLWSDLHAWARHDQALLEESLFSHFAQTAPLPKDNDARTAPLSKDNDARTAPLSKDNDARTAPLSKDNDARTAPHSKDNDARTASPPKDNDARTASPPKDNDAPRLALFCMEADSRRAQGKARYDSLLVAVIGLALEDLLAEGHHRLGFSVLQQRQESEREEGTFQAFLDARTWRESLLPLQRDPRWDYLPRAEGTLASQGSEVTFQTPAFFHAVKKKQEGGLVLNSSLPPGCVLADILVNRIFRLLRLSQPGTPDFHSNVQNLWPFPTRVGVAS